MGSGSVDRNVNLRITGDASQLKRELNSAQQAGQSAADATQRAYTNLGTTFDSLQARLNKMSSSYENNGRVGRFEVAALNASLKELERQYGSTESAANNLSASERAVWQRAKADYAEAVARLREYTAAQREISNQTRQIGGLQSLVDSLGGAWAQTGIAVFGVVTVMRESIRVGKEIDKLFGEYLPNWKKSWEDLGDTIAGVNSAWNLKDVLAPTNARSGFLKDSGDAAKKLGIKLFPDYQEEFSKLNDAALLTQANGGSLGTFLEDHKKDVEEIIHGYELFGKEAPAYLVGVKQGWDAVDASIQATKEEQKAYEAAAKKAAEEQKKWIEENLREQKEFDRLVDKELPKIPFSGRGVGDRQGNPFLPVGFDPERDHQRTMEFLAEETDAEAKAQEQLDAEHRKAMIQAAQDAGAAFEEKLDHFAKTFADAFTDVLDGKGIADAAQRMFKLSLHGALEDIGKDLGQFLGNLSAGSGQFQVGGINPNTGKPIQSQVEATNLNGQAGMTAFNSVAGFAGGVYNASQSPSGDFLTTGLSLGVTGAQAGSALGTLLGGAAGGAIGGPIGLAVGVIAAAIITIINDQIIPAVTKYAVPGISNGLATLNWTAGFNDAESKDWLSKIQKSFDSFKNGFAKIILSLPDDLSTGVMPLFAQAMAQLGTGSFNSLGSAAGQAANIGLTGTGQPGNPFRITGGTSNGGNQGTVFQPSYNQPPGSTQFPGYNPDPKNPTPPAQWQEWMQLWIAHQLPQAEMEVFKGAFGKVFENIGFTSDAFNKLWKELEGMDPKDALAALGNLVSAFSEIRSAMNYFGQSSATDLAGGAASNNQSFAQQLADADKQVQKFAFGLQYLVGQDQIDAEKQLGDMMKARQESEKQFFKDLAAGMDQVRASFEGMINNLKLQDIPTTAGKEDFLRGQANELLEMIKHAPTAALAAQYGQQYAALIMQMEQMGGNTAAWRKWAEQQLKAGEDAIIADMTRLGKEVEAQNAEFTNAMQKFIDALVNAANTINNHTGSTTQPPGGGTPPGAGRGGYRKPLDHDPSWPFGGVDNVTTGTSSERRGHMTASVDIYVNGAYATTTDLNPGFVRRTLVSRGKAA